MIDLLLTASMCWRRQWHPTPVLVPGKSHGQRSLVGCSPWGHEESDRTQRLPFHFSLSCIGEGNGNPLQCSCLENPKDGGAWWAAVNGVAQSWTWLKQLSSSSKHLYVLCTYLDILLIRQQGFCLKFSVSSEFKESVIEATDAQSLFTVVCWCSSISRMKKQLKAGYLNYFVPPEFFFNRTVCMIIMRKILGTFLPQNAFLFTLLL